MFRRTILLLIFACACVVSTFPAHADTWAPPQRKTYMSANRAVRLIVTPHRPPGGRAPVDGSGHAWSAIGTAHAVLQRRDARGRWVVQWRGPLRNEVAPVEALVADSGRYFATFDDWGGTGGGPNVVVIYDGAGRMIRTLSLLDLVPLDYIQALPRSYFSIWWTGSGHRIAEDGERLILSIAIPSTEGGPSSAGDVELAVTLATGTPAARAGPEWDRAIAAAAAARAAARHRQVGYFASMAEPLAAPRSADAERWGEYVREAFKRLAPDWETNNVSPILVRRPGAQGRGTFESDPRAALLARDPALAMAIASPDGLPLAEVLAPIVSGRRPGWLHDVRLYIVADDAAWPELRRLLAASGATLIQIDPTEPIPQRPERLRDFLSWARPQ